MAPLGTKTKYKGTEFRSKFEANLAKKFDEMGVLWKYEPCQIPWQPTVRMYKPDFWVKLPDGTEFYVEAKGFFDGMARSKMACIREQYPDLDIRFVFMSDTKKLSKSTAAKTYKEWAERYGYTCWSVDVTSTSPASKRKRRVKKEEEDYGSKRKRDSGKAGEVRRVRRRRTETPETASS